MITASMNSGTSVTVVDRSKIMPKSEARIKVGQKNIYNRIIELVGGTVSVTNKLPNRIRYKPMAKNKTIVMITFLQLNS